MQNDDYSWGECVLAGAIANIVRDWESGNLAQRVNEARELVESIFGGSIEDHDFDALAEGYSEEED